MRLFLRLRQKRKRFAGHLPLFVGGNDPERNRGVGGADAFGFVAFRALVGVRVQRYAEEF